MVYCSRTDIFDSSDVNTSKTSKECMVCDFWYFVDKRYRFQGFVCNNCHNILMMSMDLSDIAIIWKELIIDALFGVIKRKHLTWWIMLLGDVWSL